MAIALSRLQMINTVQIHRLIGVFVIQYCINSFLSRYKVMT